MRRSRLALVLSLVMMALGSCNDRRDKLEPVTGALPEEDTEDVWDAGATDARTVKALGSKDTPPEELNRVIQISYPDAAPPHIEVPEIIQ